MSPQVSSTSLLAQRTDGNNGTRILLPSEVASELNRRFPMDEQNHLYFTLLYGVLNLKTLRFRYVSAGHVPLVLMPKTGTPRVVESKGMAIGWFKDAEFVDYATTLQPGDRLYVYSDGVPEARNALVERALHRKDACDNCRRRVGLDQSVSLLLESVKNWCGDTGLKDDVSIVGMEMSGKS